MIFYKFSPQSLQLKNKGRGCFVRVTLRCLWELTLRPFSHAILSSIQFYVYLAAQLHSFAFWTLHRTEHLKCNSPYVCSILNDFKYFIPRFCIVIMIMTLLQRIVHKESCQSLSLIRKSCHVCNAKVACHALIKAAVSANRDNRSCLIWV